MEEAEEILQYVHEVITEVRLLWWRLVKSSSTYVHEVIREVRLLWRRLVKSSSTRTERCREGE